MANFLPINISYKTFEPIEASNSELSPIIFIHGLTCTKEYWFDIPQFIANKTKRKAYSYDMRNHGDSEYTHDFNVDLLIKDLFHFMDLLKIPKAILVGHSLGGICATHAALKNVERVEMVFVEDIYIKKIPKEQLISRTLLLKQRIESIRNIPKESNDSQALKLISDIMTPAIAIVKDERSFNFEWVYKRKQDGSYDVTYNADVLIRVLLAYDGLMEEPIGQFKGQTVFIYGGKSLYGVGKEEENIKRHFPKADLVKIAEASHYVHLECPNRFIDMILHYLLN